MDTYGQIALEPPSLLRFITCGSVDDGKSTLIGRLLFETHGIAEDQLAALRADSKRHGTQGTAIDFALLVDGLSAEREQGITIDIGYRYFATSRRRFIVADTPGHVQYTRNMATAASTASLAVLLVDARAGLLEQTRRHALIVSMLGVRRVVLAVNKMDLVDYAEARFRSIEQEFCAFAAGLGTELEVLCVPLCAKDGDNVVAASPNMPWYAGPTLVEHLEQVSTDPVEAFAPFRMAVQRVHRPNPDFRGYSGLIASGRVHPGDTVRVLPAGRESHVARIVTADGDLLSAGPGEAVTLTLASDLDISRGDVFTLAAELQPAVMAELVAKVLWVGTEPAVATRSYLLKIGTSNVPARLDPPLAVLDVSTGSMTPSAPGAAMPGLNSIALLALRLDATVVFDNYGQNRETGSFILIDRTTNLTVAMGMIEGAGIPSPDEVRGPRDWLHRVRERPWRSLAKAVSWRATGSADTFVVTWLVSGNVQIAASVGGFEVFTKIFLYFVHERLWTRVRLGLQRV